MAALTWRDVAAPDLRGAMQGYEQFSDLLGKALGGAEKTLTNIDTDITDRTSNAAVMDLLSNYSDADTLQADLQSGAFAKKYDPRRLNATALAAVAARPADLLSLASTRLDMKDKTADMEWEGKDRDRTLKQWGATDASAPIFAKIYAAKGNQEALDAIYADPGTQEVMSRLTPGEINTLGGLRNGQVMDSIKIDRERLGLKGDALDNEGKVISNEAGRYGIKQAILNIETGEFELGAAKIDRAESRSVLSSVSQIIENAPEASVAMGMYRQVATGLSGPAAEVLRQKLTEYYGPMFGPIGGSASGSGGSGRPVTNVQMKQHHSDVASVLSGSLNPNVVAGFLGNFEIEGGYGGARGDNGSAMGIAQWRNERVDNFVKLYGKTPDKASKAEQAKFVLWELNNPASAGMTKAQASAIKNAKSPEEAARLIDKYYERSDQKSTGKREAAARGFAGISSKELAPLARAADVSSAVTEKQNGVRQLPKSQFIAALTNESTAADAALALQSNPKFKGVPVLQLQNQLDRLVKRGVVKDKNGNTKYTISVGDAAAIMENTAKFAPGFMRQNLIKKASSIISQAFGDGSTTSYYGSGEDTREFDDKLVSNFVKDFRTGNMERNLATSSARGDRKAGVDAAIAKAADSEAKFTQVYRGGYPAQVVNAYEQAMRRDQLIASSLLNDRYNKDGSAREASPASTGSKAKPAAKTKQKFVPFVPSTKKKDKVSAYISAIR